ncbi:MAG TPA: ABC transporter permease [Kofleriaceae bacterium]|nr:ABC transporter permease [Kofleriaceae bacterium]
MFDLDQWQEIIAALRKNKLRTALTACGVFWGIFMLLIMLGFAHSMEAGIKSKMAGFATNSIFMWGQRTTKPYDGMKPGRRVEFRSDDIEALKRGVPGIEYLAPRNQLGGFRSGNSVTRKDKSGAFQVTADYPALLHIQELRFLQGRFINDLDIRDRRKVAIIGKGVYRELYDEDEPVLGSHIKINGVYFQVVGLFESIRPGEEGDQQASTIFIPFTTFEQAFHTGGRIEWFIMAARADASAQAVEDRAREVLAARHHVSPEDTEAIGSFNFGVAFGKMQGLFIGIRLLTWIVGTFTLLAGIIGVSNIMLITVKERTKEIGLRKALGATPGSVVRMIVQEAVILTAVSGYLGVIAGVGLLELIGRAMGAAGPDTIFAAPAVDLRVTLIATAVLIVAGTIAGFIPAQHAAGIQPVEALRAE